MKARHSIHLQLYIGSIVYWCTKLLLCNEGAMYMVAFLFIIWWLAAAVIASSMSEGEPESYLHSGCDGKNYREFGFACKSKQKYPLFKNYLIWF